MTAVAVVDAQLSNVASQAGDGKHRMHAKPAV